MKGFLTQAVRRGRGIGMLGAAAALLATTIAAGCGGGTDESANFYDLTVSVDSATDLNSLHFTLYSFFNDGDWVGHGDDLDCTVLVDATLTSKHYGDGSLEIWLENVDSFSSPADVVRCGFKTSEIIRDDSFDIEFHDATNFIGVATNATVAITDLNQVP